MLTNRGHQFSAESGPDEHVEHLKAILADALASFDARLLQVPQAQRNDILARFYRHTLDGLFDSHLEILKARAREAVRAASTSTAKHRVVEEFRLELQDVARLYEVTS
jgi:hypothetical protein